MSPSLRVTLRRSTVGTNPSARGTVRALGLRRIGQTVDLPDDPAVRGQVRAVRYLVEVQEVAAAPSSDQGRASSTPKKPAKAPAKVRTKTGRSTETEEAAS